MIYNRIKNYKKIGINQVSDVNYLYTKITRDFWEKSKKN